MSTMRPTSIVSLADEADVNSRIEHKSYERALIFGPAVIALLGNVSFVNGSFAGHPDAMFIEVPEKKWVQGVIGLQDVTFTDCRFENIAIIGPRDLIEQLRSEIGSPPPPLTPPQGSEAGAGDLP
jgi:hypothetical protein